MLEIILNLSSEKTTSEFGKKISKTLKVGDIIEGYEEVEVKRVLK